MLQKIIKWSLVVSVVVGGLSACMMDERTNDGYLMSSPMPSQSTAKKAVHEEKAKGTKATKASSSSSSSAEPAQKTTPGPKRAAAPQLPVIQ